MTWEHDPLVKEPQTGLMWCGTCHAAGYTMNEIAAKPCTPDELEPQQRPANYDDLASHASERPWYQPSRRHGPIPGQDPARLAIRVAVS